MLEKLLAFLRSLFSFGAKPTPTTPPSGTTGYPASTLPKPSDHEPQDGSEITPDTAVVVIKETDPVIDTGEPVDDSTVDLPDANSSDTSIGSESNDTDSTTSSTETGNTDAPSTSTTDTGSSTGSDTGSSSSDTEETPTDIGTTPSDHKPRYLWCLDNGHGKKTRGKRSPKLQDGRRILEYKFNRDIVQRIGRLLDKKGVKYFVVVPEDDVDNFLEGRVKRANEKQSNLPKLFVSVHSNAAPAPLGKWCDPKISGIETWYYHNNPRGRKIAATFQKHLVAATGWKNRFIKSRPTNQFYVLRNTRMTAILTENGFYNNKAQCIELLKDEVKDKIAAAHVDAIMEIEKKGIL